MNMALMLLAPTLEHQTFSWKESVSITMKHLVRIGVD